MKKVFLIKFFIYTCLCLSYAQTRIDTFVLQNSKDTLNFQTPFENILTAIRDKKDSRFAKGYYDGFKIPRSKAVIAHLNSLNEDIETDIFKKMLYFKSIFYEKNFLGVDEYINIQEWVYKDCKESVFAIEKLEASKHKSMESFSQGMNWIWVRTGHIVYFIDTASSYEDSRVIEILNAIKKNCVVDAIGYFESQ
jgi:hypothetical protein